MKNVGRVNLVASLITASLSLLLAGCDGGSVGGAPAAALGSTLSGVAASGAPLSNATVTLTCGDGSTKTATADANGVYSFSLTACSQPFVVAASGLVNDSQETLCSVEANTPSTPSITVNTTPLTHALCALISSDGDPLGLVTRFSTEKGNLTAAAVKDRKDAIAAAIGSVLTSAGVGSGFDIVNTPFGANRSGTDQVLDNVKVEVTTSGINLVNAGAAAGIVDDMGNNPSSAPADLSGAAITLTRTSTAASVGRLPAGTQDNSVGDAARDALNACFAQPAASRGTFAARGGACASLQLGTDYKHDGRTGSQEFDRLLTSSTYDGALFSRPEILRFFSATATDKRAQVKFGLTRSDGVIESLMTVAENSAANTGSKWMLRGNQRAFRVFVSGSVNRRVQVVERNSTTSAKSTFYITGLNVPLDLSVGNAKTLLAYAKVTGPGLPAGGLFLNSKLAGCDQYFAIAASSGATPTICTSILRLSSRGVTAADNDNEGPKFGTGGAAYVPVKLTDAQILAIQPYSAYKFELFKVGNATTTADFVYIERLRSRPPTIGTVTSPGEIDMIRFNPALSQATINAITPGSGGTFTGGPAFTITWQNLPNTPPIGFVQIQTKPAGTLFQDSAFVPFTATSKTLTNNGVAWPSMAATAGVGNFNFVQLATTNKYGTNIFHDWQY